MDPSVMMDGVCPDGWCPEVNSGLVPGSRMAKTMVEMKVPTNCGSVMKEVEDTEIDPGEFACGRGR